MTLSDVMALSSSIVAIGGVVSIVTACSAVAPTLLPGPAIRTSNVKDAVCAVGSSNDQLVPSSTAFVQVSPPSVEISTRSSPAMAFSRLPETVSVVSLVWKSPATPESPSMRSMVMALASTTGFTVIVTVCVLLSPLAASVTT